MEINALMSVQLAVSKYNIIKVMTWEGSANNAHIPVNNAKMNQYIA